MHNKTNLQSKFSLGGLGRNDSLRISAFPEIKI